ncbi:hypothetical protein N0V88_007100 [Collariella sp. IMI 366227]|nr:hypothetical protein N0V88_007100 [Collariella sp. IMI 366227]
MSSTLRIPHPQTPLHLYRHLRREASYLPPLARTFADSQIEARFRKSQKDEANKCQKRLRNAHHELRILRAANAGDMARMQRVLFRAFGRVGRRRRELMTDLLARDPPKNTEELEKYIAELAAIATEERPVDWLDSWDVDRLRALARSQAQAELPNPPKPDLTLKQTQPTKVIPEENSWGRQLTPKLARTKLKNMWRLVADKCMAPLPREEWEKLGSIVKGEVPDAKWLPPPRRPVAQCLAGPEEGRSWNWQYYATKPVAVVDRPARRRSKLLSGAVDDNSPGGDPLPIGRHNFTPRTWRRMMEHVWKLSPTIEKAPSGRGWNIEWGKTEFKPVSASTGSLEFFKDFPEPEPEQKQKSKKKVAAP